MVQILKHGSDPQVIYEILDRISKMKVSKPINAKKYCGILKLDEKPILMQRKMRDEWE